MNGWEAFINVVVGHVTVALVALSARKFWPDWLKFILAGALAAATGAGSIFATGAHWSLMSLEAAFGVAFAIQQTSWHLKIGVASPGIVEPLQNVGSYATHVDKAQDPIVADDPAEAGV